MQDLPAGTAFQGDLVDPTTGERLFRILPHWFRASERLTTVAVRVSEPAPRADSPSDGPELIWVWGSHGYWSRPRETVFVTPQRVTGEEVSMKRPEDDPPADEQPLPPDDDTEGEEGDK